MSGKETRLIPETQVVNGVPCSVFECPLAAAGAGADRAVVRLWLSADDDMFPLKQETGSVMPDGSFQPALRVEVAEVGRTNANLPFPKNVTRELLTSEGTARVASERSVFEVTSFNPGLDRPDSFFKIDLPKNTRVNDLVAGTTFRVGAEARAALDKIAATAKEAHAPLAEASRSFPVPADSTKHPLVGGRADSTAPSRSKGAIALFIVVAVGAVIGGGLLLAKALRGRSSHVSSS